MIDLAVAPPVSIHEQIFDELCATSQSYTGCPKFVKPHWINRRYFGKEVVVLPLHSGGTEVAASPIVKGTDWLNIKHPNAPLALYPDSDGYVDSSEVVRSCNTYLSTLTGYLSSDIQLPLIQLQLKDVETSFNLLLTIPVDNKKQVRIYYLIADGHGNWKRVSPEELEVAGH